MSLLQRVGWRRGALALAVAALLIVVATQTLSDEPEIALLIGEPWEDMRGRSSAAIDPAIPARKSAQRYTNTPNSFARATACVRRSTPSLLLIWLAWVFTVCREMNSWSLIS
jgi:hypothetical protein